MEISINKTYRHKRTGNDYGVISTVKVKTNNGWVDGVAYSPLSIKEPLDIYVRELSNFIHAFDEV